MIDDANRACRCVWPLNPPSVSQIAHTSFAAHGDAVVNVQGAQSDPLADLRGPYFERLRRRIDALSAFVAAHPPLAPDTEDFDNAHRSVHSMINSAAIFGYAELSAAARAAETAFEQPADAAAIVHRVEELVRIANRVSDISKR